MFERYVHVYALAWIGAVVLAYNAGFEMLSGTIVLGGIVAAYIGDYKQKQRQDQAWQEYRKKAFSEEGILEAQNQLESRIEQQRGCPDAFSGKAIYIYKHLMKPWFNELSARWRYEDEKKLEILRKDFATYLEKTENHPTLRFLSLEGDDAKKQGYEDEERRSRKIMVAIEDGLATAIGQKAVAELKRIRELPFDEISDNGELAPDGYHFRICKRDDRIVQVLATK